jgi:hypothetical protein
MIKLSVYHRPHKRWPKHPCLVNTGAFYSGWTGAEPFGTIFIYRYYGYQVNCSACIKTRQHFFQRFEDAVFDLELLMTKAFEIGELPFCRPQGLTARQIAGSARRASVRSLSACREATFMKSD